MNMNMNINMFMYVYICIFNKEHTMDALLLSQQKMLIYLRFKNRVDRNPTVLRNVNSYTFLRGVGINV